MTSPRIAIVVLGTRGDLDPHLALARALQARGADPRIVGFTDLRERSEQVGIPFAPVPGGIRELLASAGGQQFIGSRSPLSFMRAWRRLGAELVDEVTPALDDALSTADQVVLCGPTAGLAALTAKALGIPAPTTCLQPQLPTRQQPVFISPLAHDTRRLPLTSSERAFSLPGGLPTVTLRQAVISQPLARWSSSAQD